jgi:4-deoxy-L-threo-5-hexosulose-uronate ketol-isomerase
MFSDQFYFSPRPCDLVSYDTKKLRDTFLVTDLFSPGEIRGVFTDLDRLSPLGAVPLDIPLELGNHKETGRDFFLESRELGVINIANSGKIIVDGQSISLNKCDMAYIPMGTQSVRFASDDPVRPARFYGLSCPAHARHPLGFMNKSEATMVSLGTLAEANQRVIRKFIHPGGLKSCQLVMGYTELAEGSVWNTFPPHTHNRRPEIYMYFDLNGKIVVHFMGQPQETRHLMVHERQVVLCPSWSIHCGCATGNYRFVWGMAGENQRFDDMDGVKPEELR